MNNMNNSIDELNELFNHNTALVWKPNLKFLRDIEIITSELLNYHSYVNVDIYEVLVSCGHSLTWDQEYYLTLQDFNWFKTQGKLNLVNELIIKRRCTDIFESNAVQQIHQKLVDLFELQVI